MEKLKVPRTRKRTRITVYLTILIIALFSCFLPYPFSFVSIIFCFFLFGFFIGIQFNKAMLVKYWGFKYGNWKEIENKGNEKSIQEA